MSGKHGRRRVVSLPPTPAAPALTGPTSTPSEPTASEPAEPQSRSARRAQRSGRRHAGASVAQRVVALSEPHGTTERDARGRLATLDRDAQEVAPIAPRQPIAGVDLILPGGGSGSRRLAREEKQQQQRRRKLIAGGAAVVVALIVWAIVGGGAAGKHHAVVAGDARTQSTVLVQLKGPVGSAIDSALLGHDTAAKTGVVVLVPSSVIGQVPGFGPMPFGQVLTLGQTNASRQTLTDLIGVSVDGAWVLTQAGMKSLIDKVGGVNVTVDRDVTAPGPNGTTTIMVAAGAQRLNGANAVAYASFMADGETEQTRLARFDAVFAAVLSQLPKQPAAIASVIGQLGAGSTSTIATTSLANLLLGLAADNAANSTFDTVLPVNRLDTGTDQEAFSLDTAKTRALVQQQFAESIPLSRTTTGNRVMIENQVGTPGIGETTREKLMNAGYVYISGQNAPGMPNATAPSVVLISGTTSADIAQGNAVAKALGLPTSDVRVSQQNVRVADVIVLLGADYKP